MWIIYMYKIYCVWKYWIHWSEFSLKWHFLFFFPVLTSFSLNKQKYFLVVLNHFCWTLTIHSQSAHWAFKLFEITTLSIYPSASWVLSGEDQEAPAGKLVKGEQLTLTQEPRSLSSVSRARRLFHKPAAYNAVIRARWLSPQLVPEMTSSAFSRSFRKNTGGGCLGGLIAVALEAQHSCPAFRSLWLCPSAQIVPAPSQESSSGESFCHSLHVRWTSSCSATPGSNRECCVQWFPSRTVEFALPLVCAGSAQWPRQWILTESSSCGFRLVPVTSRQSSARTDTGAVCSTATLPTLAFSVPLGVAVSSGQLACKAQHM